MPINSEMLRMLETWRARAQFSSDEDWVFADIRTTMNVYGDVVTDEMEQAHSKVLRMALAAVN
jgi:hypothetical protein